MPLHAIFPSSYMVLGTSQYLNFCYFSQWKVAKIQAPASFGTAKPGSLEEKCFLTIPD
jgi:hypothetical protein